MSETSSVLECPKLNGDRIASQQFALMHSAYLECSDAVRTVISDMCRVYTAKDATEDEREAALSTIIEALFPKSRNGALGISLDDWARDAPLEVKVVLKEMDREEASFAERVNRLLDMKGMTQGDLAVAIGVGQPAISMLLKRECRPQRRTVQKIAEALKVSPEEIWPGFKDD